MRPLAIDLFCGLGGWAEGFLAEGYDVVGFDIERHDYGTGCYSGQLVLQDVRTLHGSQFRNAAVIVASPPCQEFSYMAMPWKRAKQISAALRGLHDFPDGYRGSRTIDELTALFSVCFRIQHESGGVPLVVENSVGAQAWVGKASWKFGSYYLWGNIPALMPKPSAIAKISGQDPHEHSIKQHGSGEIWFDRGIAKLPSNSERRKAASAQIAKIPFPLAQHIARCYAPAAYTKVSA